jgi:hypothetical protein
LHGGVEDEGAGVGGEAPLVVEYKSQRDTLVGDGEADYNTNGEADVGVRVVVDVKVVVDVRGVDGGDGVEIDAGAAAEEDAMYSVEKENGSASKTNLSGGLGHVEVGDLTESDFANEGENEEGAVIANVKEGGGYRSYEVAEAEEGDVEVGVADDGDSHIHSHSCSGAGGDTYISRRTTSYLSRRVR